MKTEAKPEFSLVETSSALSTVASHLEKRSVIAVDLEADSMFHYHEKVCLLQISTRDRNFLIDPLSINDLSPLSSIFSSPGIEKIFHGGDYDVRSLYRDFGFTINRIFDTHIAARFLGLKETGLSGLLKENFGIIIEKKYQKMDWSKRPLSQAMLSYAILDSFFLIRLSLLMKEELRRKGRLFCVEEECRLLCGARPAAPGNEPLFLRFKGAAGLDSKSLALLEAILQFRKEIAMKSDIPPFKIMGNASILEMVEKKPMHLKDLENIGGLSRRKVDSIGKELLRRMREALNSPVEILPALPQKRPHSFSQKAMNRIRILKEWRLKRAEIESLDPSIILTNAQIIALACSDHCNHFSLGDIAGIREWQVKLFGDEICRVLGP